MADVEGARALRAPRPMPTPCASGTTTSKFGCPPSPRSSPRSCRILVRRRAPGVGTKTGALGPGAVRRQWGLRALGRTTRDELTRTSTTGRAPRRSGRSSWGPPSRREPRPAFEAGDLDYSPIGDADAAWIHDKTLGPRCGTSRRGGRLHGFDTADRRSTTPGPPGVRRAVDWQRIVTLAGGNRGPGHEHGPAGIPGHATSDFGLAYDPVAARELLAAAGYPGERVSRSDPGRPGPAGDAILADLKSELGITFTYESWNPRRTSGGSRRSAGHLVADVGGRLSGPERLPGRAAGHRQSNNYGHWSSAEFDEAIAEAGAATEPAAVRAAERGRGDRPTRRAGRASLPTAPAGRWPGRGCRGRPRTGSGSSPGRPGVGDE